MPLSGAWNDCGFPPEAEIEQIDFMRVRIVVTVDTEGRAFDYRTGYQRDRDRIVYSRAFRRLRQKAHIQPLRSKAKTVQRSEVKK